MKIWQKRKYEVKSKADPRERDNIRYTNTAYAYAMIGIDGFPRRWGRFRDSIDDIILKYFNLTDDYPEMSISEKMDSESCFKVICHKMDMAEKIIRQAFGEAGPLYARWENRYNKEACDHLRPSRRTGRPQMMINGEWQDMKEIVDEDGGPSVWVRDDDGGKDAYKINEQ